MRKSVQIKSIIEKEFPNLNLNGDKIEKIKQYLDFLTQWGKKINLTAIKDYDRLIVKHVLDSLIIYKTKSFPNQPPYLTGRVLDMGSGAGLPGIILILCNPSLQFLSVDKSRKKIMFQNFVKAHLNLANFEALALRMEELLLQTQYECFFNCIVSRAFKQIKELFQLAYFLLKEGGFLIVWKGKKWQNELEQVPMDLKNAFVNKEAIKYEFQDYDYGGVLLIYQKKMSAR